jgi:hypothetical protein
MSDLHDPSDSAHPDEALAGLVGGTLSAAERAELQAHLDGCERCRSEVAMAESAARALGRLPELDAPWGLGRAAIEEARRGVRAPRSRRIGMVAGVAAAAILVAGLSFAVLRGPQGGSNPVAAPASSTPFASSGGGREANKALAPPLIRSTHNFSAKDVERLASSPYSMPGGTRPPLASTAPTTAPHEPRAGGATTPEPVASSQTDQDFAELDPVACIDTAAGYEISIRPVRVIDARFEEKPALIGIFLNSPGAGQRPDLVVVWVASKQCDLLTYASHRISP